MFILKKSPEKDFIILNITDPQLSDEESETDHLYYKIFDDTMKKLLDRVHPDLITVTGDISWSHCPIAHKRFCDYMDALGVKWAPVWGNHDCDMPGTREPKVVEFFGRKNCLFENGDERFGNGNYIIRIDEGEKPVEALFMLDSHDRMPYIDEKGEEKTAWAKLYPEQIEWMKKEAKAMPCECSVFLHIPIYAYREAFAAAFRGDEYDPRAVKVEESADTKFWRYGGCSGVMNEEERICSYPEDDGAMAAIEDAGNIRLIVCGHDHTNNFIIPWRGVKFVYGLKTGAGCYWKPDMSGGTVITIGSSGVKDVHHEFVEPLRG